MTPQADQGAGRCGRFSSDPTEACWPLADHERVRHALAELVRLKDGPRDEVYRDAKDTRLERGKSRSWRGA